MSFWGLFKRKKEAPGNDITSNQRAEYIAKEYIRRQVLIEAQKYLPKPFKGICTHKYHKKGRTKKECEAIDLKQSLEIWEMEINAEVEMRFYMQRNLERFAETIKSVPEMRLQYLASPNSCKACLVRDKKIFTLEGAKSLKFHFGCGCSFVAWQPGWPDIDELRKEG